MSQLQYTRRGFYCICNEWEMCIRDSASRGATTHPEIVAGIIEYLQERGFSNLVMLEGSQVGAETGEAAKRCGYQALSEKYGVPFIDTQQDESILCNCADMPIRICKSAATLDFLINVCLLYTSRCV